MNTQYKISAMACPPRKSGRAETYPFNKLAVGEMFAVPCSALERRKVQKLLTNSAAQRKRTTGRVYAVRYMYVDAVFTGVGVWRVA